MSVSNVSANPAPGVPLTAKGPSASQVSPDKTPLPELIWLRMLLTEGPRLLKKLESDEEQSRQLLLALRPYIQEALTKLMADIFKTIMTGEFVVHKEPPQTNTWQHRAQIFGHASARKMPTHGNTAPSFNGRASESTREAPQDTASGHSKSAAPDSQKPVDTRSPELEREVKITSTEEQNLGKLGLKKGATLSEMNSAYKKLAAKYHPDRNKEPGASEKMQEINNAMAELREQYPRES
jgi:DnaJ domain